MINNQVYMMAYVSLEYNWRSFSCRNFEKWELFSFHSGVIFFEPPLGRDHKLWEKNDNG